MPDTQPRDAVWRVKRSYSVIAHSADEVELRYGVWNPISFTVNDDSRSGTLHRLLRRLDGSLTPAEIAREEGVARSEVEGLIDHLLGLGVLEDRATSALDHYLDYLVPWRREETAPRPLTLLGDVELADEIARAVGDALPTVVRADADGERWRSLSADGTVWLHDELAFRQRLPRYEAWRDRFLVVALRTLDPLRLHVLNRICGALGTPWMPAALDGPFLLVGPIVIPGRTACFECLETRVTMNLRESASYQRYKSALVDREVQAGRLPLEPAVRGLLASHTALEAMNFALTGASATVGKLFSIHLPTMEISFHEVLRLPGCAACAPIAERDDRELYFDVATFLGSTSDPAVGAEAHAAHR